jgi:polysaccharide export outer membrane protein
MAARLEGHVDISASMFGKVISSAVGIIVMLGGCTPAVTRPAPLSDIQTSEFSQAPPAYKIGAGDEIEVKFFFAPDLNDRILVRPDGKISVMFAQDIMAAGKTPEELVDLIKQKLSGHVKQLDLTVVVRTYGSQKLFVGGEVGKPGPVFLSGPETLLQVLGEAGWVTPFAGPTKIALVRRGDDGKENIYSIDASKLINGEDLSQNVYAMAGDVVIVPPSGSVAADRWVDQNLRQMLFFNTSASLAYNINEKPIP